MWRRGFVAGIAVAVVASGLALRPPPASGQTDIGGDGRIAWAKQHGSTLWPGLVRCPGVAVLEGGLTHEGADGEAHPREPLPNGTWRCEVRLSPRWRAWPLNYLCLVMAHELGHLTGITFPENPGDPVHSPDPRNLMYADTQGAIHTIPACAAVAKLERRASWLELGLDNVSYNIRLTRQEKREYRSIYRADRTSRNRRAFLRTARELRRLRRQRTRLRRTRSATLTALAAISPAP